MFHICDGNSEANNSREWKNLLVLARIQFHDSKKFQSKRSNMYCVDKKRIKRKTEKISEIFNTRENNR